MVKSHWETLVHDQENLGIPPGSWSIPSGFQSISSGFRSIPPESRSIPVVSWSIPLGSQSIPLGSQSIPLGSQPKIPLISQYCSGGIPLGLGLGLGLGLAGHIWDRHRLLTLCCNHHQNGVEQKQIEQIETGYPFGSHFTIIQRVSQTD
jgi:hypothetical protein